MEEGKIRTALNQRWAASASGDQNRVSRRSERRKENGDDKTRGGAEPDKGGSDRAVRWIRTTEIRRGAPAGDRPRPRARESPLRRREPGGLENPRRLHETGSLGELSAHARAGFRGRDR